MNLQTFELRGRVCYVHPATFIEPLQPNAPIELAIKYEHLKHQT